MKKKLFRFVSILTACLLLVVSLGFNMTDAKAEAATGTDYNDCAYYDVSWGTISISTNTAGYISRTVGSWDDLEKVDEIYSTWTNIASLIDLYGTNMNSLFWYGWVDESGYWNGHITGRPTVTNTVTGEETAVTGWTAEITQDFQVTRSGYTFNLGSWSVSGTGSTIETDTIQANLPQVTAEQYVVSTPNIKRALSIRLYLEDGNSISLNYASESTGMDQLDAVTASGGRGTAEAYFWDKKSDLTTYRGNTVYSFIYLNEPDTVSDYHFYIEKTISGVKDNATYSIPVQVSINGGAPITVNIETTGNGTFEKEVSFRAYTGDYTVSVTEDPSDMPVGVRIVDGSDTAAASLSTVAKNDENTASIENDTPEYKVTYHVVADPEYGTPSDGRTADGSDVPSDDTGIAYNGTDDLASGPSSNQDYAYDKSGNKIPGTWSFSNHWTESATEPSSADLTEDTIEKIDEDKDVYGQWTFTPVSYQVNYVVKADPIYGIPEDSQTPDPDTVIYNGDDDLKTGPTTTQNYAVDASGNRIPGTWVFSYRWSKDTTNPFQSLIMNNRLTGITEDQYVYGQWTFLPDTYQVMYVVNGDPTYGTPTDSKTPSADTGIAYDGSDSLQAGPSSNQDYAYDKSGNKIPGTWTFTSHWTENRMDPDAADITADRITGITSDKVVYGQWTFTPGTYKVTYVVNGDPTYGTPDDGKTVAPDTGIAYNGNDDLKACPTTTQDYAYDRSGNKIPGIWTFTSHWTEDQADPSKADLTEDRLTGITENKTVYGQWTFTPDTYKVTYVVNGDPTYGTPSDGTAPVDGNSYISGDKVTVADQLTTGWKTSDGTKNGTAGTWTFTPWDKDDFTITEDTVITGGWTFTLGKDTSDKDTGSKDSTGKDTDSPETVDTDTNGTDTSTTDTITDDTDSTKTVQDTSNETVTTEVAKTGDPATVGLHMGLMLAALIGIFSVLAVRTKKR